MAKSKKMTFKEFKEVLKRADNSGLLWIYSDENGNPDFEAILNSIAGHSRYLAEQSVRLGCGSCAVRDMEVHDFLVEELTKRGFYDDTIL